MNIEKKEHFIWNIPAGLEKIISFRFESSETNKFKCHVACNKINKKIVKIIVFQSQEQDSEAPRLKIGWKSIKKKV